MDSRVATPPPPAGSRLSEREALLDRFGGANGRGGGPGQYPPGAVSPPPRRRYLWRVLLGCVIVLLATAGATAVAVLEQVQTIVQYISVTKALPVSSKVLAAPQFGQPETLLLVGNDTRSGYKYYKGYVPNLANEMLLVRIDPAHPWISMLSLPRELWVNITEPNGTIFTNRLNSAYTFGTTTLLRTIKQVTGLSANHVIVTTFPQFENAINKLGCVYDTIDERYYHNNALGGAQYQNIDLLPGYQCLNGSESEQFVSYRHTDTSQVRDARDQSFLLAVKKQYGPQLAGNIGKFEKVFGETVRTDSGLRSTTEILHLANLLVSAAGLHVRQVPFQTTPCTTTCPAGDLTATPQQIQSSVHDFLYGKDVTPTKQVAALSHKVRHRSGLAHLPLTPTLASNVAAERADAARLSFTAEFPSVQDMAGSATPVSPQCTTLVQDCVRNYEIHAPNGRAYPAYVEVFSNGQLGQFYDIQGTTWTGAPLFSNPTQTIRVGKRTYNLYYDGSHITTIAWREYGAVYWVHNTLSDAVGNGELLAIAEQTAPIGAVHSATAGTRRGHGKHVILKAFSVPTYHAKTTPTPMIQSIGQIGGLVTLIALPVGLLVLFFNRRRLGILRDHVNAATATAGAVEARLVAAGAYKPAFAQGATGYAGARPGGRYAGGASGPVERYRSRRPVIALTVGLVILLAAGGAYLALHSSALGSTPR
ncbi:MAG: LCP family protein, partial [Solirubrobacteraceae bacterium]